MITPRQTITDNTGAHQCAVCKQKILRGVPHYVSTEIHPTRLYYPRVHVAELAVLEKFEAVIQKRRIHYINPNARKRLSHITRKY